MFRRVVDLLWVVSEALSAAIFRAVMPKDVGTVFLRNVGIKS